jgi:hypothetical protein
VIIPVGGQVAVAIGAVGVLVAAGVLVGAPGVLVTQAGSVPVIMRPGEREAVLHENCVNAALFF